MLITFYAHFENTSKWIKISKKSRKLISYSFFLDHIEADRIECKLKELFSIVILKALWSQS